MKALQIIGYGEVKNNLAINELEKPTIGKNDVLIDVHAASINPIDYKIVQGALKQVQKLRFPAGIGFDLAGVIVEIGSEVKDFEIGDEVYSRIARAGTFAEQIVVNSNLIVKKPKNLSFEEASSIPLVGLTCVQAFELVDLKAGDKVLVHAGSGGIGTFAIQYAKAKGAYVFTTTSTKNVDWVKTLGADEVIDYKKTNYLDVLNDLDIVLDTLGGNYTSDAFKIVKSGGKVVSIAGDLDDRTAKLLGLNGLIRFILRLKASKTIKAAKKANASYYYLMMKPNAKQLADISLLLEASKIKPVIDKVFSFKDSIDALLYQKEGRAKGKVVIKMK